MSGARALRRKFRGKRTWGVLAAAAALAIGVAIPAMAVVNGSPSMFESNDGNMVLNTPGNTDWNCFVGSDNFQSGTPNIGCKTTTGAQHLTADPNGETELTNGTKFDTPCPTLSTGNNPPKDEFTDIAQFSETASNLDEFFYGATLRSTNNGNASGNVEFDQSSGNGTTTFGCRIAGDRLMAYDFLNGGTSLSFHVLTWIDSTNLTIGGNNGTCFVKSDTPPCWGAHQITPDSTQFEGQSNQSPITAANNGINGQAEPINQFAEFGINLTQTLGLGGKCIAFPQQVWESRSSGSSFTSNPQDIEINQHKITNCGEVVIIKHTDPRGLNQSFSYTSDLSGSELSCTQSTPTSFSLNDSGNTASDSAANTQDCTFVPLGSYHVTEGADPSGFTFKSLSCSVNGSSSSSGTQDQTNPRVADITIGAGGDVVTCTYVNQQDTATLATQVSTTQSVFPGNPVHDTATVTGNQATKTPSGSVEFFLCSAGTVPCSSGGTDIGAGTLSGSGATASATSPDVNTSSNLLPAGTYCFRAEWGGDTNYPTPLKEFGGPTGANECFTVQVFKTTTTTTPSVGSGGTTLLGTSVFDTALVQAAQTGDGTPTGTVTFFLCDPTQTVGGACPDGQGNQIGSPVPTTDTNLSPPATTAQSDAVVVDKTGTWCWRAVYTPGGVNGNNYTGSEDASTGECFIVQQLKTTTTTTPSVGHGGSTTFGSSVTDHAIVQAVTSGDGTPTGTVTFFICDPTQTVNGVCPDGAGTQIGSPVPTVGIDGSSPPASSADSTGVTVNQTGTWCWRAVYTPDTPNYSGSEDASNGECFTVTDTTASASAQNWLPNDVATVSSTNGAPLNGTLSATLFESTDCSGTPVSGQSYSVPVSGDKTATLTTNNSSFFVSTTETVSWLITFTSNDGNVTGSTHCESTSLTINN